MMIPTCHFFVKHQITAVTRCNSIIAARNKNNNNNNNRIRKLTQSVFQQELLGYHNNNDNNNSNSRTMSSVSNNASFYTNDRYTIRNTLNNFIKYNTKHGLNQTNMTTINCFSIQTPSTNTSITSISNDNNNNKNNVHVETKVSTGGSMDDTTKMSIPTSSFSSSSSSSSTTTTTTTTSASITATKLKRKVRPRKAAVQLTERARQFFRSLLIDNPLPKSNIIGIVLNHHQSTTGEPRMVYSFDFHYSNDNNNTDDSTSNNNHSTSTSGTNNVNDKFESVSLEVIPVTDTETGSISYVPKPYDDSVTDNLPKLFIHPHAFLKVLGATVDIDTTTMTPILYDRSGNVMDPNA